MSFTKTTRTRLENLRRSSRTEILRQRAEAQKIEALKQQPPAPVALNNKTSNVTTKKKSLKKKKKSKRSARRKIPPENSLSTRVDTDDGFIPDEPAEGNAIDNLPKQFDELAVWKQYQNFGDNDDGFIPDDDTTDPKEQNMKSQGNDLMPVRVKKRKLSDIWKKDNAGKKLSKRKRRKAERKWLKKLFHESVIIAEPQDNEPTDQACVPYDQVMPCNTIELPVEIAGKTLLPTEDEDLSNKGHIPVAPELLNGPDVNFTVPDDSSYLQTNGNAQMASPWKHQSDHMDGFSELDQSKPLQEDSLRGNTVVDKSPLSLSLDDSEELEGLRIAGGFSKSDFMQHLVKLCKNYNTDISTPIRSQAKPSKEPEVLTNFVDLTSGKTDSDEKKKRYKMELSLPEKTTILVTNMVGRESSLPKVIFMLKKGQTNGSTQQESPLLMGCSGDSNRNGSNLDSDTVLIKEMQEITQHILKVKGSNEAPSKNTGEESTAIHKALEYSME